MTLSGRTEDGDHLRREREKEINKRVNRESERERESVDTYPTTR